VDQTTLGMLCGTAAFIGFAHTAAGPDHYIPFIAMARAGRWSLPRTVGVTLVCGVGHVAGSLALGALGIALGLAVGKLAWFENMRGNVAGWLLLGFGLAYAAWGVRRLYRSRPHSHLHVHADGTVHAHPHAHEGEHVHVHAADESATRMTPWILFTIFVFGPCEPLIPLLMYPAAKLSMAGVALVTAVFAAATLATMTVAVALGYVGLTRVPLARIERYTPLAAGLAIAACGAAVQLGL
jgi:nickel/cobalt exporter